MQAARALHLSKSSSKKVLEPFVRRHHTKCRRMMRTTTSRGLHQLARPQLSTNSLSFPLLPLVGISMALTAGSVNALTTVGCDSEKEPTEEELQQEWDNFLAKSIIPGEDDDDDDDEDDDDEEEDDEEEDGENDDDEKVEAEEESDEESQPTSADDNDMTPSSSSEETAIEPVQDPYDDLPADDEPTHCSICRINREGPCRPLWRKFEKCMKDHSDEKKEAGEENTPSLGEKCDNYMMPWVDCFQQHRGIYTILTNKFYQNEYLDDAEAAVEEKDRMCWAQDPDVDWTGWLDYLKENKMTVGKLFLEYFKSEQRQLFLDNYRVDMEKRGVKPKRAWYEEDPQIIDCQARVALKDAQTDLPIEVAYARDQDGKILGFENFNNDKKEGKKESALNFSIHLADTKSIKICAIYQEEPAPQEEQKDGDAEKASEPILAKRLYYSKPITVIQPMAEAELLGRAPEGEAIPEEAWEQEVTNIRTTITQPPYPSDEMDIEKEQI